MKQKKKTKNQGRREMMMSPASLIGKGLCLVSCLAVSRGMHVAPGKVGSLY